MDSMFQQKLMWSLVSILNALPFLAGVLFQHYFTVKNLKRTLYYAAGLVFLTIIALFISFDHDVIDSSDVSDSFFQVYLAGFVFIAYLHSKEIIIPMNGIISLLYTCTFWIMVLPELVANKTNFSTSLFIVLPALVVTTMSFTLSSQKMLQKKTSCL